MGAEECVGVPELLWGPVASNLCGKKLIRVPQVGKSTGMVDCAQLGLVWVMLIVSGKPWDKRKWPKVEPGEV